MENVKIKSIVDTGKVHNEKPIIEIELEDGRKGACYDDKAREFKPGQSVEFEIKEGKEYQGEKRYYFNIQKERTGRKFQKDWQLERKKIAIESAIRLYEVNNSQGIGKEMKTEDILKVSDRILKWLND